MLSIVQLDKRKGNIIINSVGMEMLLRYENL